MQNGPFAESKTICWLFFNKIHYLKFNKHKDLIYLLLMGKKFQFAGSYAAGVLQELDIRNSVQDRE